MNLFKNLFSKSKKDEIPEPINESCPGWNIIEETFNTMYPGQHYNYWEPKGIMAMHDRKTPPENPLYAIAVYDAGNAWHYVSFGLTDLYGSLALQEGISGFGYEFTMKVNKDTGTLQAPFWPIDVMVTLAQSQYSGSNFAIRHTVKYGPLDGGQTKMKGFIMTEEINRPGLIDSPNGQFELIRLVGITEEELTEAKTKGNEFYNPFIEVLKGRNPDLITKL
jgi:Suppressor of fused protein (SUFU)